MDQARTALFVCGREGDNTVVLYRFPPEEAPDALPLPPKVTAFCGSERADGTSAR